MHLCWTQGMRFNNFSWVLYFFIVLIYNLVCYYIQTYTNTMCNWYSGKKINRAVEMARKYVMNEEISTVSKLHLHKGIQGKKNWLSECVIIIYGIFFYKLYTLDAGCFTLLYVESQQKTIYIPKIDLIYQVINSFLQRILLANTLANTFK